MINGFPQASDLIGSSGWIDPAAGSLKATYAQDGINAPGESGTSAVKAYQLYVNLQTLVPGNQNALIGAANFAMQARWDKFFAGKMKAIIPPLDNLISVQANGIGRTYVVNGGAQHALDAYLLRMNACHAGVPLPFAVLNASNTSAGTIVNFATGSSGTTLTDGARTWTVNAWAAYSALAFNSSGALTSGLVASNTATVLTVSSWSNGTPITTSAYVLVNTPSVSATSVSGGALPSFVSGSCPYVAFTAIGANDYDESLMSLVCGQVAMSGANNALRYALSGVVPTPAPRLIGVYRTLVGQSITGPYFLDHFDSVVTGAGSAWPTYVGTLTQSDAQLVQSYRPPLFLQCPLTPEGAMIFALSFSVSPPSQTSPVYNGNSPSLNSTSMLNPANALLNPANGFAGLGNAASSMVMGTTTVGSGFVAGSIQTVNVPANGVQGFLGAYASTNKIQARSTTNLNGTRTPTITYTYYDSLHPGSNPATQTGLAADSGFTGSGTGEIITFSIVPGRVVISVTETGSSGGASSGVYVYESATPRTI